MTEYILREKITKAGFEYDYQLNEYNETRHQLIKDGKVIYESYNGYCVEAFIAGIAFATSN
ncbi:hypothetical protein NVP1081O_125 [Vibrio phage 1.081.O._10N.286.52.C2]|nr:hypothetical protein NVP1081O_125 [Vibrio phage 1.081.O._10N.286.52.C2]